MFQDGWDYREEIFLVRTSGSFAAAVALEEELAALCLWLGDLELLRV